MLGVLQNLITTTVNKPPLSGFGYSGYPPGTVRKRGIILHSGCVLTVVVTCAVFGVLQIPASLFRSALRNDIVD